MKTILLDAGHGNNTAGKRSPIWSDGTQLFEWEFNRDIVRRIQKAIPECKILVHEDYDVSLAERCHRANQYTDAILISIHANAGGGTGWECYTSLGQTGADKYASILFREAEDAFPYKRMRKDFSDGDPDKEENFYILKHTKCPAILTENFFMDNEDECKLLMSDYGRFQIAEMHIKAIQKMLAL